MHLHASVMETNCGENLFNSLPSDYPSKSKPFWFMKIPGIEDKILSWKQKSNAWRSFATMKDQNLSSNKLCLTFSLYIDCPYMYGSSTVSLKQTSINLHSGMIPAPQEPDMTTISHILAPLVDELILLNTGIFIKTPLFPKGQKLLFHLSGLIGDIIALHKTAGFVSHSAKFFCSWCKCQKSDLENMQLGPQRKRQETRLPSHNWQDCTNLAEQTQLLKSYGTRWSELNCLPLWKEKTVSVGN
ncbi:hypothetical protein VP01_6067g1 [Puccinia sorghi]|uniref:Uncharacterized protein n=1 Tax=Puccinia sorghi TaxID=27349 RepID=A0A0L6UJC0_9BASI|nr:hypothetical protein VP01_6067g1 [Puccinia sorghi]